MWAVITGPDVVIHDGKPSLAQLQEAVGGYICTALRHPSNRKNVSVDAYVNDDGLCIGQPIFYTRSTDRSPLAGPIVITATNDRTGNTVEATQADIDSIRKHLFLLPTPILEYEF